MESENLKEKVLEIFEKAGIIKEKYETIKNAFEEYGYERLKPVFDYLQEKFSYDELRLARVLMKNSQPEVVYF